MPAVLDYTILAHRPVEPGDDLVQAYLGEAPPLDLQITLGEGCCAAIGMHLLDAATALLREMATFEASVETSSHTSPSPTHVSVQS